MAFADEPIWFGEYQLDFIWVALFDPGAPNEAEVIAASPNRADLGPDHPMIAVWCADPKIQKKVADWHDGSTYDALHVAAFGQELPQGLDSLVFRGEQPVVVAV